MFWNKKKKMGSDEFEALVIKISTLRGDLSELEQKVSALHTNLDLLRGQFNRKLAGLAKEAQPVEPEAEKPKDLNRLGPVVFSGMQLGLIPK